MGLLRADQLGRDGDVTAGSAMRPGPSTFRPNVAIEELVIFISGLLAALWKLGILATIDDLGFKQWHQGKHRNRPQVKHISPAATLALADRLS
jgi:hypothetical protein